MPSSLHAAGAFFIWARTRGCFHIYWEHNGRQEGALGTGLLFKLLFKLKPFFTDSGKSLGRHATECKNIFTIYYHQISWAGDVSWRRAVRNE